MQMSCLYFLNLESVEKRLAQNNGKPSGIKLMFCCTGDLIDYVINAWCLTSADGVERLQWFDDLSSAKSRRQRITVGTLFFDVNILLRH